MGVFKLLLVCVAISIFTELSFLADSMVIYAFYALVVGVILQFACFLKDCKEHNAVEAV